MVRSLLFVLLALLAVSCSPKGDDAVLATVGDRSITVAEFNQAWFGIKENKPPLGTDEERRSFLNDIVNKNLMELGAYDAMPELTVQQGWRLERFTRMELRKLFTKKSVHEQLQVTKAEKDLAYEQRQKDVFLDAIICFDAQTAQAVMDKVAQGEDFENLALAYSVDEGTNPEKPWEQGWVSAGRYDWQVQREVWQANPGDIVGPFHDRRLGHLVFRVVESKPIPAEDTREAMELVLDNEVREDLFFVRQDFVADSLRAAANPQYPLEGLALLMDKYYWELPEGLADDPYAGLNANRVKPEFTEEEGATIVISFDNTPDWTAQEFADRLEWYPPGLWPKGDTEEKLIERMDMMVREFLELKAGEDLGYADSAEFKTLIDKKQAEMRVNFLYHNVITPKEQPTEDEILAWFEENRERYKAPPSYRLALFSSLDGEAMAELRTKWKEGASFSSLKSEFEKTVDDLESIGDSFWIYDGQDPAVDELVINLKTGSIAELFVRNDRTYVFRVLDRRGERLVAYEEIKQRVDEDVAAVKKEEAMLNFLNRQREKYPVTINESVVAKLKDPSLS